MTTKARILHLEDNPADAALVQLALERSGLAAEIEVVDAPERFRATLSRGGFDMVLSDSSVAGFTGLMALREVRSRHPALPFICVSGAIDAPTFADTMAAGANGYALKDRPEQIVATVRNAVSCVQQRNEIERLKRLDRGRARLVAAAQDLSLARTVERIREIVRHAAREMTGADGATFVLREGDFCHYVDEDAISPLWKGQRFPLNVCISGWAMQHGRPAVIEDIYADPRIPADAYRPTFVKSLVMVPIRPSAALGAIGNYWAHPHHATPEEVDLLQALANTTAVAMESTLIHAELERRVKKRTAQLEAANQELEAFSYSVSHDLRAPLRAINGFTHLLQADHAPQLDESGRHRLDQIRQAGARMGGLIEDLLRLARLTRGELRHEPVDLSQLAEEAATALRAGQPDRPAEFVVAPGLLAQGDRGLLRAAMENLLSNAWKFTARTAPPARIQVGADTQPDGSTAYYVRDNGAGFDMGQAHRLFTPFQRLHAGTEFAGNGVGLATVQRIIRKHGGRIWAEAEPGRGATFRFTLPAVH